MTFSYLEDTISLENPIGFIDGFVENVDLRELGFEVDFGFIPAFLREQGKFNSITSWPILCF